MHELEFANALQLKIFQKGASASQINAAKGLVESDLKSGILASNCGEWLEIYRQAVQLAEKYTSTIGCRSLDILRCAAAKTLGATEFISTDSRQKQLAVSMELKLSTF